MLENPLITAVSVNGKIVENKEDFFQRVRSYMRGDPNYYYNYLSQYKNWVETAEKRIEACRNIYVSFLNSNTYYRELVDAYFKEDMEKYLSAYRNFDERVNRYRHFLHVFW